MIEEQHHDQQGNNDREQYHDQQEIEERAKSEEERFRRLTMEGNWEEVMSLCEKHSWFCMLNIDESRGTALHVAVNEGNKDDVKRLVQAIINGKSENAFECKNERGDTPLHLAAIRGFKDICECIIGENKERKKLTRIKNNDDETPLFHATLSWQKQTFLYLCDLMPAEDVDCYKDLIRKNGDTILHCAIQREFFDLALIIMDKYRKLFDIQNREGFSPLKLLATRPSAFKSGSNLIWWKRILYHCVSVETRDVEEKNKAHEQERLPKNYSTCYQLYLQFQDLHKLISQFSEELKQLFIGSKKTQKDAQNDEEKQKKSEISIAEDALFPPNYDACLQSLKLVYIYALGLSGVGVEDIKKLKQKHKWSIELLKKFMETPYESYIEYGGPPPLGMSGVKTDILSTYNKENIDEKKTVETVILVAARHGIVEMVNEIISHLPSAIHETNSEKKNVLLVAVENRQTLVVEALKDRFGVKETRSVLDNLIIGVDEHECTVLHLAATLTDKGWRIPGAALQMMWHIKWFQYIKELVPGHVIVRTNDKQKTAGEIFKESHKALVKEASEWLKDTSESCSLVAALLAGVSFATSSSVPGGNTDSGEPALEGKPAFEAFALCSLIGLCFSVTALIMFLSILTSRKEVKDFKTNLPLKVLFGLSSLFISIIGLFATFCSGHFFVIDDKFKQILFLMYAVTCLPVSFYAVAQFPLYIDLLTAIATKVPRASDKGDDL